MTFDTKGISIHAQKMNRSVKTNLAARQYSGLEVVIPSTSDLGVPLDRKLQGLYLYVGPDMAAKKGEESLSLLF